MKWPRRTQSISVALTLFRSLLLLIACVTGIESGAVLAQTSTPVVGVSPSSLSFTAVQGGANPATKYISVSNTGGGTLSWSSTDNSGWMTADASGTNSGTIPVNIYSQGGVPAGTYSATVTITVAGYPSQTKFVPITVTVTSSSGGSTSPTIGYSPTSLSFSGTVGGSNPAGKAINISNTGGGTLSWTISENASWLSVSRTSGTNTGSVTVSPNLSGLAAGTYNAAITITATGATNTPKTIPVSLTVSSTTTNSATLTWTANAETDLAGYKIYLSRTPGSYGAPIRILGKTTGYTATGLTTGVTYYFVITSYDTTGNESAYSNEVSKSIY